MTHKIVRADGTIISNVKKCIYIEDVNGEANLRPGCVSSAHIDVTVYGLKKNAPEAGEKLTYYWVTDDNTETKVGYFYAEPAINSRMTYKFIAYDAVAKLDADFSARLSELQDSFPMTLGDIVSEAATIAGVNLYTDAFPRSGVSINAFYADNITCRQILSWAAEMNGKFVRCDSDGLLRFDWYSIKNGYRVYPTSTNLPLIIRNPSDINAPAGTVYMTVLASNATSYQWQYRSNAYNSWANAGEASATTDTLELNARSSISGYQFRCIVANSYGAVETKEATLTIANDGIFSLPVDELHSDTEVSIAYKQNGMQYENYSVAAIDGVTVFSADEGESSSSFPTTISGTNVLTIYNNLLLTDASSDVLLNTAYSCYASMSGLPEYRPSRINLFPSENPFRAGDIIAVTDAQGFSFATPVMAMVVDNSVAKVRSTGEETYEEEEQFNPKTKIVNMASSILRLKKLFVEELDAITARINTLFANEIVVTGSLHSDDYAHYSGQPFAARGMSIDLGQKSIDAPYYSIDGNGNMSVRSVRAGDLYFSDAFVGADSAINHALYQMIDSQGAVSTNYSSFTASATLVNSYEGMGNGGRTVINGYLVNEVGKIIYRLSTDELRYAVINVLAPASIVSSLPKATVDIKYFYPNGQSEDLLSAELEYGTFESGSLGNALYSYIDFFYYANLPRIIISGGYVEVSVSMQAGTAVSLDSVNGYYSAWYGYNNNHTYGGTGTYVGTDGISADKMQVNGNDVWNKGDFTLPLPIDKGGTGATTAIDALENLKGMAMLYAGYVSSSSPVTLTFSSTVRFVVFVSGTGVNRQGAALVYSLRNATAVVTPIGTLGSQITITPGTGSITISTTYSSASAISVHVLCLTSVSYNRITVS